jgi:phosphoesterase RecJ-like protein
MRLLGFMMYEKLRYLPEKNTALLTLTYDEFRRFHAAKGDTEGIVNMPLQIKGVRFSCFLREGMPGKVNVSLRSVDDFPCNRVAAEFFNGGGHMNASGGELHCSMESAVEIFRNVLQKCRNELME